MGVLIAEAKPIESVWYYQPQQQHQICYCFESHTQSSNYPVIRGDYAEMDLPDPSKKSICTLCQALSFLGVLACHGLTINRKLYFFTRSPIAIRRSNMRRVPNALFQQTRLDYNNLDPFSACCWFRIATNPSFTAMTTFLQLSSDREAT